MPLLLGTLEKLERGDALRYAGEEVLLLVALPRVPERLLVVERGRVLIEALILVAAAFLAAHVVVIIEKASSFCGYLLGIDGGHPRRRWLVPRCHGLRLRRERVGVGLGLLLVAEHLELLQEALLYLFLFLLYFDHLGLFVVLAVA